VFVPAESQVFESVERCQPGRSKLRYVPTKLSMLNIVQVQKGASSSGRFKKRQPSEPFDHSYVKSSPCQAVYELFGFL